MRSGATTVDKDSHGILDRPDMTGFIMSRIIASSNPGVRR